MSGNHANVETVNRMTEAVFSQDHDTLAKIFADDLVFHLRGPDPMAGDHSGLGGFLAVFGAWFEATNGQMRASSSSSASGPTGGLRSGNTPRWAATDRRSSLVTPSCTGSRAIGSRRCGCSSARSLDARAQAFFV